MTNLADDAEKLVAKLNNTFYKLNSALIEPVDSSASPGQAAFISANVDNIQRTMVKYVEEMLQVTRQIRELWIVGPLRLVGEGEREDRENMDQTVNDVLQKLNALRDLSRQQMVAESGGALEYEHKQVMTENTVNGGGEPPASS